MHFHFPFLSISGVWGIPNKEKQAWQYCSERQYGRHIKEIYTNSWIGMLSEVRFTGAATGYLQTPIVLMFL